MSNKRNKEQVYDEEINPLMAKILAICKEHKIAMVAQFSTPNDEDPDLLCTSALLDEEYEPHKHQLKALDVLKPKPATFMAFTITTKKSEGQT